VRVKDELTEDGGEGCPGFVIRWKRDYLLFKELFSFSGPLS